MLGPAWHSPGFWSPGLDTMRPGEGLAGQNSCRSWTAAPPAPPLPWSQSWWQRWEAGIPEQVSLCVVGHTSPYGDPRGMRRPWCEHTRADAQPWASCVELQHRVHLEAALLPTGQVFRQLPEAEATASQSPRSLQDRSAP